jgi:hypothetical protein
MGFISLSWMEDHAKPDINQALEYAQQIADILNIPKR